MCTLSATLVTQLSPTLNPNPKLSSGRGNCVAFVSPKSGPCLVDENIPHMRRLQYGGIPKDWFVAENSMHCLHIDLLDIVSARVRHCKDNRWLETGNQIAARWYSDERKLSSRSYLCQRSQ